MHSRFTHCEADTAGVWCICVSFPVKQYTGGCHTNKVYNDWLVQPYRDLLLLQSRSLNKQEICIWTDVCLEGWYRISAWLGSEWIKRIYPPPQHSQAQHTAKFWTICRISGTLTSYSYKTEFHKMSSERSPLKEVITRHNSTFGCAHFLTWIHDFEKCKYHIRTKRKHFYLCVLDQFNFLSLNFLTYKLGIV